MAPGIVIAFDAYGTLFDTRSIAMKGLTLQRSFGSEEAFKIAATWRRYQLEYTWRANSMGVYLDFSRYTRRALSHACAESGLTLSETQADEVMESYDQLLAFDDVPATLRSLSSASTMIKKVIFSNGTESMVENLVANSACVQPHGDHIEIVSVDDVRKFKPAPEVYHHLADKLGKNHLDKKEMGEIWLVSSNPFDIVGGRAVGMNAIYVDRNGRGWEDNMMPGTWNGPTEVVGNLKEVVKVVWKAAGGTGTEGGDE